MISDRSHRDGLPSAIRRIVVKVGSRILVDDQGRPDPERIEGLAADIAGLHLQERYEVILVTSGAIAAGVQTLGWSLRPQNLPDLQMAAAVGQSVLMHQYSSRFSFHNCRIGQVLLTHADLRDRERHLNARNAMLAMLRNEVIPVVNENDVVAVDEIRFGDNDLLASMVATLVDADLLILLTTADGFFRTEKGELVERISLLEGIDEGVLAMAGGKGSSWSTGGMASKLKSAEHAVKAGIPVVIANGATRGALAQILEGKDVGTLILGENRGQTLKARKKWLAFFHRPQGTIVVDDGAEKAIRLRGNSLLPVGVDHTRGEFSVGALVNIENLKGTVVARGITSYSRKEIESIKGIHSAEIPGILGECHFEEVIHRDNMVLLDT